MIYLQTTNVYCLSDRDANIVTNGNLSKRTTPCKNNSTLSKTTPQVNMMNNSPELFTVDTHLGRWDNGRLFKTHEHVYTGPSYRLMAASAVVSLATQTSVDRLYWLVQASRHWTEPISVAVFTPDIEYGIAKTYFQYLTTCFPFIGDKITVHFSYPKDHPPLPIESSISDLLDLCDQPVTVLRRLLKRRSSKVC